MLDDMPKQKVILSNNRILFSFQQSIVRKIVKSCCQSIMQSHSIYNELKIAWSIELVGILIEIIKILTFDICTSYNACRMLSGRWSALAKIVICLQVGDRSDINYPQCARSPLSYRSKRLHITCAASPMDQRQIRSSTLLNGRKMYLGISHIL